MKASFMSKMETKKYMYMLIGTGGLSGKFDMQKWKTYINYVHTDFL